MDARGRSDAMLAAALALLLTAAWSVAAWPDLVRLRLPDTDDAMRLQQVRDWLAGQAFGDVAQHRLGTGVPGHWSRLFDLPTAALIAAASPLVGRHAAEVAAVIAWPAAVFAAALWLVARIARRLAVAPPTAVIVAAIAYPSTTTVLPGRIDHHGVQLALLLAAVLASLGPPTIRRGAAWGGCAAASLTIGLETAPVLLVLGLALLAQWIRRGDSHRLIGAGAAAVVGLVLARWASATGGFAYPACDGFTRAAWTAAIVPAAAILLLPPADRIAVRWHPVLDAALRRTAVAGLVLGVAAALVLAASPDCLHPYGRVDPLLARLWLGQVAEAQAAWAAPPAAAIGYLGLPVVGVAATVWQWRRGGAGWGVMLAVQVAALAIALVQLRGAQSGAMLAAPALAATIGIARARGPVMLAAAWLAAAGPVYPLAASTLVPAPPARPAPMRGSCGSAATVAALARLPRGTVIAPIDAGAWILAGTRHRVLAAPLHRNAAGNLATYRFYLGAPLGASAIARGWRVDYVLACAEMPGIGDAGSAAAMLARGAFPGAAIATRSADGAVVYRLGVGEWRRSGAIPLSRGRASP